jgi:hypothetical protein
MLSSWHKELGDFLDPIIVEMNSMIYKLGATFSLLGTKGVEVGGHASLAYNWKKQKKLVRSKNEGPCKEVIENWN